MPVSPRDLARYADCLDDAKNTLGSAEYETVRKSVTRAIAASCPYERFAAGVDYPEPVDAPPGDPAPCSVEHESPNGVLPLSVAERARHLYVIGKTGTGKSTLLKALAVEDAERGCGLAFLDPAGDAVVDLLGLLPANRHPDMVVFDPTSNSSPRFNPLRLGFEPDKLTADLLSAFRMFYGDSWGPRLEHILRHALLSLLVDREPHSLRHLRTLLTDRRYRASLASNLPNEELRAFWESEFPRLPASSVDPILNKLSEFLAPTSAMERIFSEIDNDLDFPRMLQGGAILLANLAKGTLGDGPSRLLGGLIATGIQQAALGRVSLPEPERRYFYLYVDEFHNYAVSSFETILTEGRKYRLSLTLAHQLLAQLSPMMRDTIFGTVETIVAFNVSADDAARVAREIPGAAFFYVVGGVCECAPTYDAARAHWQASQRAELQDAETRLSELRAKSGVFSNAEIAPIAETVRLLKMELDGPTDSFRSWICRSPQAFDLTSLPPHRAMMRHGSARSPRFVQVPSPPTPDATLRAAILRLQNDRWGSRSERPSSPSSAPEGPASAQPIGDDDFAF